MPRVLITRAAHQASGLAEALQARGCETILIPAIEIAPLASYEALDKAIAQLGGFHWLLFTSANAVEAFARRTPSSLRGITSVQIAAIGQATARAVEELLGTKPSLVPPQAVAESLSKALVPLALQDDGSPTRFLLVRAEQARDALPDALRTAGGEVAVAPAYRTIIPAESVVAIRALFRTPASCPNAISFTSSSSVTNLLALLEASGCKLPEEILRVSIGPITTQTMRDQQIPPDAEAVEPTVQALAGAIVKALEKRE